MADAGAGVRTTNKDALGASERCAVREAGSEAEQAALSAHLAIHGLREVERFAPEDDDELDTAVRDRRFDRVVFVGLDALLTAVFKGDIRVDRWMELGVRIELAEAPEAEHWQTFVRQTQASLCRWRRTQRRRQIVACAILSAIALAAMAALFFLVPQAK